MLFLVARLFARKLRREYKRSQVSGEDQVQLGRLGAVCGSGLRRDSDDVLVAFQHGLCDLDRPGSLLDLRRDISVAIEVVEVQQPREPAGVVVESSVEKRR